MYKRERMLFEVMRRKTSRPLDDYKVVINSYCKIADEFDIALAEDYMAPFKKNDFRLDILQREGL